MNRAAYRSAIAHPYHVSLHPDWSLASLAPPLTVGFQTEEEARAFAASRPEPIIDLTAREYYASGRPTGGGNIIGVRRMVQNPDAARSGIPFEPRDDFPETRP